MVRVILAAIRMYQKLSLGRPRTCRFYPTCSQYAYDAILSYGVFKGGFLAIKRILKCHPFHPGGIDFVGDNHS